MAPSPTQRVAARDLLGGLFKLPPALHKEMEEWMVGAQKATRAEGHRKEVEKLKKQREQPLHVQERVDPLLEKLREKPRGWAAYRDLANVRSYDLRLHRKQDPYEYLDYKTFRSLSKEEKAKATARFVAWMEKYVKEATGRRNKKLDEDIVKEQKQYDEFKVPKGAKPGPQSYRFGVDLKGWEYNTPKVREAAKRRLIQQLKRTRKMELKFFKQAEAKGTPLDPKLVERQGRLYEQILKAAERSKFGEAGYTSIVFELRDKSRMPPGAAAYWSPQEGKIVVPFTKLDRMKSSLKHETLHMAQEVLSREFGYQRHSFQDGLRHQQPSPGLPSKRLADPTVDQGLVSRYMDNKLSDMEKQLYGQLRDRGVGAREIHSLDDIEFYSLLGDSVGNIRKMRDEGGLTPAETRLVTQAYTGARKFPPMRPRLWRKDQKPSGPTWNELDPEGRIRKVYNGQASSAFGAWKKHSPGKYKKGLKELTKAVAQPDTGPKGGIQALWQQFLDEKYEGGKAKVANPNSKTRDRHPEITVSYLIKQSEPSYGAARQKLRREFAAWRQQQQGPKQAPEKAPAQSEEPSQPKPQPEAPAPQPEKPKAKAPKKRKKAPPRVEPKPKAVPKPKKKPKKKPEPKAEVKPPRDDDFFDLFADRPPGAPPHPGSR